MEKIKPLVTIPLHLLKYDTRVWRFEWRCYITTSFLYFKLQYGAVMCYFTPTLFALINKESLAYSVGSCQWLTPCQYQQAKRHHCLVKAGSEVAGPSRQNWRQNKMCDQNAWNNQSPVEHDIQVTCSKLTTLFLQEPHFFYYASSARQNWRLQTTWE